MASSGLPTAALSAVVTLAYIVVLVVAGLRAHSLSLLSEAGHNFSDLLALVLSWIAYGSRRVRRTTVEHSATLAPVFLPRSSTALTLNPHCRMIMGSD